MKKTVSIMLSLCLVAMLFCGCSKQDVSESIYSDDVEIIEEIVIENDDSELGDNHNVTSTNNDISSNPTQSSQPTGSQADEVIDEPTGECRHTYQGEIVQKAELFKAGTKKYTCQKCGNTYTNTYPLESIKILSLGNSYSKNGMWMLYDICEQAGVKEIDIAFTYMDGRSVEQYWQDIQTNASTYRLFRNNSGEWKITENYSVQKILSEKDWDVIFLQTNPYSAAMPSSFENFDNLVNHVSTECPDSVIAWYMTWAFQSGFPSLKDFENSETLMYDKIVDCVKSEVITNSKVDYVLPVGTAIMNVRTSRLKGDVHTDHSHLSDGIGCHVAAFTWYRWLTGQSLYDYDIATYTFLNPTVKENIDIVFEAAENAIANPYEITQSYFR